jgi:hypothetical protein
MFAEVPPNPAPIRMLRIEEAELAEEELKGPGARSTKSTFDPFALAEAKDIFEKYSEKWCDKVLNTVKWTEKKALLE